jgi:carbonic anhydrase
MGSVIRGTPQRPSSSTTARSTSPRVTVSGHVYDVVTGRVETVIG